MKNEKKVEMTNKKDPDDVLKENIDLNDKDVFLYNGAIIPSNFKEFSKMITHGKGKDICLIIMTSNGGSPDSAYMMARCLHRIYGDYSVLIYGPCKSAATLFVTGANELIFGECGELGPLDVQIQLEDKLYGASGLNMATALSVLEDKAILTFSTILTTLLMSTGGVVSIKTGADIAANMASSLYRPILSRIDPEELGSRQRDFKIGIEYAKRLNHGNLKEDTVVKLVKNYPSHSFVIDLEESNDLICKFTHHK